MRSPNLISTSEAAEVLGCTVQHLRLLIREGKVQGERFGRDWVADSASVTAYKTRRGQKTEIVDKIEDQKALFADPDLQPIVNVASVPKRSPFRYPGGKTWLVPIARMWLASLSPRPLRLIEPFAGGGGIGLMAAFEGYVQQSLLIELDPNVASVWRTILGRYGQSLATKIKRFECTEENVRATLAAPPKNDLDRAFQTILRNRVSRGGILAPGAGFVKHGEANKGIASRWYPDTLAKRIADIRKQGSRLAFKEADGLEMICQYAGDTQAAFFVDPPYPVAGKRLYTHHDLDHRELFNRLASAKGPFLATYNQNPDIQSLAEEFGFEWRLVPMKSTHHAKKFELVISRDVRWLSATS